MEVVEFEIVTADGPKFGAGALDFRLGRIALRSHFQNVTGLASVRANRNYTRQLLLEMEPAFSDGRVPIFVCEECGDLGCGAVSVAVEASGDGYIVWRDFAWSSLEGTSQGSEYMQRTGPMVFDELQYRNALCNCSVECIWRNAAFARIPARVISSKGKKQTRMSSSQGRALVEAWRSSGQSMASFCNGDRAAIQRLSYWKRRCEAPLDNGNSSFVMMTMPHDPEDKLKATTNVEIQIGNELCVRIDVGQCSLSDILRAAVEVAS